MADKRSSANPTWLKWLVMAFIAYAAYLHFTGKPVGTTPPTENGKAGLQNASRAVNPLKDVTDLSVKIGGDIKGSGDEALCGQTATVRVAATLPNGQEYTGKGVTEGEKDVHVGKADDAFPWMAGLTGMSAGGVRELLVPADRLMEKEEIEKLGLAANDTVRFRVQLEKLTPTANRDAIPLRVMDTVEGNGNLALCGDEITYNLILWKQDGTELYNSGTTPIAAQLGDSSVFYGLDRALLGMRVGGVRTAIVPPAYLVSPGNDKKHPALAALPEGQLAIADISLVTVKKPQK